MSIYQFTVKNGRGQDVALEELRGRVLLIVNTASKCGFAPQFSELQELHETWHARGLEILAFPCNQFANQEPGDDEEIQNVCKINFGLTFPLMAKIDVNGKNAHPLYRYLREQKGSFFGNEIKWNFTKFLVDATGNVVGRYAPTTSPKSLGAEVERLIARAENSRADAVAA